MDSLLHILGICGDHGAHFSVMDFLIANYDSTINFIRTFKIKT